MSKSEKQSRSVRNLKIADGLFQFAFEVKSFQLKKKYPELTEKEIRDKTLELIEKGTR